MGVAEAVRNPRAYTVEMVQMYRALLFDPGRFYDEFLGERGLRNEILVVAFVGLVGSIGSLYAVVMVRGEFDTSAIGGDLPRGVSMQLYRVGIGALLGAFVLWIVFTLLMYTISWVYSEEGGIYPLLKNTAWALVPLTLTNAILSVGYVLAAMDAEINTDLNQAGGTTARRFAHVWEPIAHDTMVVGARAAGLVFVIWVGYIAAHAVADVRDLEARKAYVVAGITMLVYVLWEGFQLVGITGGT